MICDNCGRDTSLLEFGTQHLCIKCYTNATQAVKPIKLIKTKGQQMTEQKDFEMELKEMENLRHKERDDFYNSVEGKLYLAQVDFKCWCHSKGKLYDLNENDFKEYKKTFGANFDFNLEKLIYEKWFGYEFQFDEQSQKWKTKKNKHWVLNGKEKKCS